MTPEVVLLLTHFTGEDTGEHELPVEIPLLVISRAGLPHSIRLQSHTPEPLSYAANNVLVAEEMMQVQ